MKKALLITLASSLTLSVFSTGFTLKDNSAKKAVTDHAVIISARTKAVDYTKNPITANGLEIISEMDKMAESEEYVKYFTGSEEMNKIIADIGKADYSSPKGVYMAEITGNDTLSAITSAAVSKFPKEIQKSFETKVVSSIPSLINSKEGVNFLAASAILTSEKSVILEGVEKNSLAVYVYDDYCVMISYIPYGNDVVGLNGTFVKADWLSNIKSADELNDWFKTNLNTSLAFSEIK